MTGTICMELWLIILSFSFWGPLVSVVDLWLSHRFLLGWACAYGAGGVGPSAYFRFWGRVSEVC